MHVSELSDPSPYLEGDEMVLTAGVWRGRQTSAKDFVRALETKHVVAIGYGLLDDGEPVPAELVQTCKAHQIPLLQVPVSTPFVAITRWFVEQLAVERERQLRERISFTSELLAAAHEVHALSRVTELLSKATNVPVRVEDGFGRSLAASHKESAHDSWVTFPIAPTDIHPPHLQIGSSELTPRVRELVDASIPVVGLVLARARAVREVERRLGGEVVSLVLAQRLDEAQIRFDSYGIDAAAQLFAFVCSVSQREEALLRAERWLEDQGRIGITALRGDEITIILAAELRDDPSTLLEELSSSLRAQGSGAGSTANGIANLRRSLVEARQACLMAARQGRGAVLSQYDLASHALILALADPDVLSQFRESLLGRVDTHDRQNGTVLVATLQAFLDHDGRWQETADALFVHVNTLRNRLEKVSALTGKDLSSTQDRVDLFLALNAFQN